MIQKLMLMRGTNVYHKGAGLAVWLRNLLYNKVIGGSVLLHGTLVFLQ